MRAGQASRTAVYVCMGRAVASGMQLAGGGRFEDPTALALLPGDARTKVERFRAGAPARGVRARFEHVFLERRAQMMLVRTVAIDEAVGEARSEPVVILGAGLDGRAWRMAELADAVVFEVDHPDTQRDKRARLAGLAQTARDVRFVPVDFTRDSLDDALDAAGHDPVRSTTWIWEGVVMYLTRADVEASLAVVARRTLVRGRLVVAYHAPAPMLWIVGPILRTVGEPLRSKLTPDEMRALLARHAWRVVRDDDLPSLGAAISAELGGAVRALRHLRIVVADHAGPGVPRGA